MIIKAIPAGIYDANCYILIDEKTREGAIIDPGGDELKLERIIKDLNFKPKFILLTHAHMDHVGGVEYLSKLLKIPFYMHENEENYVENDSTVFGNIRKADGFLKEDTKLNIGNLDIKVIHTPGHTQGGVCFLVDGKLFSGDTLFQGSIGRTDFPGGDMNTILSSIKDKLLILDDGVEVYPGHGPKTTIGFEKKINPFLN
ncbi:MBL fold metallo-hydrolase [Clostridium thermobutyricum]|uniref:Putative metallo-hydrolase n=1 Tax=Clostridium thermobutyricum DSM 4928 TaxID=1121339 RepID=A0A1V4SW27_9CLOT|nr:MBL fold metallo-hydrolase [Clostridium thermobutyricum]OPX48356.1 putative metallo-hydrolase [Clostridium thermobutyricum DSM 4928]